jgi:hypothetical protein
VDAPLIFVQRGGRDAGVELVGVPVPLGERLIEVFERRRQVRRAQAEPDGPVAAAGCGTRSAAAFVPTGRVDGISPASQIAVERP